MITPFEFKSRLWVMHHIFYKLDDKHVAITIARNTKRRSLVLFPLNLYTQYDCEVI